jgi:hypothetical protein
MQNLGPHSRLTESESEQVICSYELVVRGKVRVLLIGKSAGDTSLASQPCPPAHLVA